MYECYTRTSFTVNQIYWNHTNRQVYLNIVIIKDPNDGAIDTQVSLLLILPEHISGGENLSSVEVESVLYMHPAVNEAAVVARPDEFWGETPCAFVSLKTDTKQKPTEEDIIEFCRSKLPRYMVPKTVVFKEELPKTSTGKIQKYVLRDMAKVLGTSTISRM